ncbi:TetR/AcrR family transcriptional regulator [Pseudactinotalea sp. Z1739]|uniref:TetR/AcrR family transcriptional regulator n=1 Tax=Pseudactinotalea sp. Z1739 TaxID=3413028 RepID=UPI003C798673
MSQREALLQGAKKCLVDKGYSRTTARDITAASGAHLASIGYHFGSKDRLMNLAAMEMSSEWGDRLEHTVRSIGGASAGERLAMLVSELVRALPGAQDLHSAALAAIAQAPFDQELREELTSTYGHTRRTLASVVLGTSQVEEGSAAEQGLGTLVYALVIGLGVQALTDPDSLPAPEVAADAVRALAAAGH